MLTAEQILGQDESLLVECDNGFLLLPDVCVALKKLQHTAQQDGVDIHIVSSYRSFERQNFIWQNKWHGKAPLLDLNEQPIDGSRLSDWEKIQTILTWSALPGASRHHWGTDLDVYDKASVQAQQHDFKLVCAEYDHQGGPCAKLNQWLGKYAGDFGFSRPYAKYEGGIAREPWHLSYQAISDKIVEQLDPNILLQTLIQSNISGLESISNNMPEIYSRFVLNKGK